MGDRIYVADSQESVFFMKYKKAENQLYIYADDTSSRYLTTQLQLDYDTLCGADKFGNVFMMRLPADLSQQVRFWLKHCQESRANEASQSRSVQLSMQNLMRAKRKHGQFASGS